MAWQKNGANIQNVNDGCTIQKKRNWLNDRHKIKKAIYAFAVAFSLFVCVVLHCTAITPQSQSGVSADSMDTEQVTRCCAEEHKDEPEVQLHFIMIACLILVGGSLGMVLFNMKINREE